MKYSFVLDKPSSKKPTYIFVMASPPGGRLKYSIKEQILPDDWNSEFWCAVTEDKQLANNYEALNRKLARIRHGLDDMIRDAKREGTPITKTSMERKLDILSGVIPKANSDDFFYSAAIIYKEMEEGKLLTPKGNIYEHQTLVNYKQSMRVLKEFKPALRFSEITMDTYQGFISHCNKEDLSMNSTGTHIKCWKRLISIAFEKGWHKNTIFIEKKFKTIGELTDDIYLSEEELKTMWEKNLLDKSQELCRDWFILDAYTGLRISDIQQLNKRNLTKGTIIIANEKTDRKVEIPQHRIVKAIIKKYKGLPPKVSDQEINREIKKVAELCKINETVLYVITKGGKRQDNYYKKYEMVSNHTARRSFITNCRKNGVPDSIIMKLTGITKPQTLQKYDRMSTGEAAKLAAKHSFFKG